jgi:hypothetical protein
MGQLGFFDADRRLTAMSGRLAGLLKLLVVLICLAAILQRFGKAASSLLEQRMTGFSARSAAGKLLTGMPDSQTYFLTPLNGKLGGCALPTSGGPLSRCQANVRFRKRHEGTRDSYSCR